MSNPLDRSVGILVTIPHNLESWFVKTIERQTARGNEFGFIAGADGKVMWNDDGTIFNKKWAEGIAKEHNDWLEEQKPITLKLIDARREVNKYNLEVMDQERVLKEAKAALKYSIQLLEDCEHELSKLKGAKDGKESD
jgi:hypothetical protein